MESPKDVVRIFRLDFANKAPCCRSLWGRRSTGQQRLQRCGGTTPKECLDPCVFKFWIFDSSTEADPKKLLIETQEECPSAQERKAPLPYVVMGLRY